MSQLSISFGIDGKNSKCIGPLTVWKNLNLKSSNLWKVAFIEVDELSDSERGEDGFGSTDQQ